MNEINVCLIGGGSIWALKPKEFDSPDTKQILTHAHALFLLKKQGCINDFFVLEKNYKKQIEIREKWGCKVYSDFLSLKGLSKTFDYFIVAVPTEFHCEIVEGILKNFNPKVIVIEKPFCNNFHEANLIFQKCRERGIKIVINYIRRYSYLIDSVAKMVKNGLFGKVQACNVSYVRGFMRDGSHALDLCNFLFGDFLQGSIVGNSICDYSKEDLTYSVWMEFENCKNVFFTPLNGENFSIFEINIFLEDAKICFFDHCQKIKIVKKNVEKIYGNFSSLDYENIVIFDSCLDTAIYYLHNNVIGYLLGKQDLICTGSDGVKVQQIFDKLCLFDEKYKNLGKRQR